MPVSLPSALVRQRPHIRAVEALWRQASAQVGVAPANLYPRITLSGSYGSQANGSADLFGPTTSIWNVGASLLQPLFHGGELTARRRAAIAAYDQAAAQYRDTVLHAFQNVADALRALEKQLASGGDPAKLEHYDIVTGGDGKPYFRYTKGLVIGGLCMNCHGPKDSLSDAVKAKLATEYPNDQATGYQLNQFRGAISITRPL